nr:hypothetical protein [Thermoproteota archaeon]
VRKIEDCSIDEGNSPNLQGSEPTTLEAAIAINDKPENKFPKLADQSSATSTRDNDSIAPNSTTLQPAIAITRKSAQSLEQQRAKVYDLLQKGETRKKVAEILRISEGSVDRSIKHRKKHQEQTEQVVQQQIESPRQLRQQQTTQSQKSELVTVHSPQQLLLPPFEDYTKNFASFDCEWYKSDVKENRDKDCADQIYCFCLIDVHGKREQLHINQFGGDRDAFMNAILDVMEFMNAILDVMERYPLLVGYWIFGDNRILSDLDHIKMNCVGNLQKRFERMKERIKFLDVHKIFSNRAIQGSLSGIGISYREESLNAVAIACLGGSEGKIQGLFGFNIETEPPTKQLEYCLQDAQLCMKLVQKNDYDLMRILYYIGNEVGLDLVETANASGPITWWTSKLESIKYGKAAGSTAKWMNEHTIKDKTGKKCNPWYAGGHVLEPIPGQHPNVLTFDVSSMYPTMSHIHNISSETICCECCKDDPDARIPTEVMNDINERLKNEGKEPRPWYYWICKLRTGKLGEVMKDLIAKKIEFKRQKLKLKEKAVKLLVNSGYGTFGNPYFPFYDVRVSELITGFARYTLGSIRKSLTGKGCKIVYGDTDSLFLSIAECSNGLTTDDIISEAKNKYGVIFELNTTWKILLLTDKQKTYLGLTDKYQVDGTTMLGVRSNKPKYFHDVTNYLSSEQSLKRIIDEGAEAALTHIISYLRSAYNELEDKVRSSNLEFIRSKLAYYESSKKSIYEQLNGWRGDIYNEILKEECRGDEPLAKSKCYEGRVYQIWKVESTAGFKKENVYSMHPERHLLNLEKYKEELWTGVKDMLLFYGLDKNRIEDLKSELVK